MNINTELHRTIGADAFARGEAFNESESRAWKQGWLNAQAASTSENSLISQSQWEDGAAAFHNGEARDRRKPKSWLDAWDEMAETSGGAA